MLVGTIAFVIIMGIGIWVYWVKDKEFIYVLCLILSGAIFIASFFYVVGDKPITINYSVYVSGDTLYFSEYQMDGNDVQIPAYCRQLVWPYSHYIYCDEPITIVVPDGQKLIIRDLRPQAEPYIVGGCK